MVVRLGAGETHTFEPSSLWQLQPWAAALNGTPGVMVLQAPLFHYVSWFL